MMHGLVLIMLAINFMEVQIRVNIAWSHKNTRLHTRSNILTSSAKLIINPMKVLALQMPKEKRMLEWNFNWNKICRNGTIDEVRKCLNKEILRQKKIEASWPSLCNFFTKSSQKANVSDVRNSCSSIWFGNGKVSQTDFPLSCDANHNFSTTVGREGRKKINKNGKNQEERKKYGKKLIKDLWKK